MQNKENLSLKETTDGGTTLYSAAFDQYYHSIFGPKQESDCVFIDLGLAYAFEQFTETNILEMGFGTGFNALLTAKEALLKQKKVSYTGLEAYPITAEVAKQIEADLEPLHLYSWDEVHVLSSYFSFQKIHTSLQDFQTTQKFNLVYYDAFAPSSQPELWTLDIFEKLAGMMEKGGILTTYCSKSYVQRNLRSAGFLVEKHPGPYRKREILRAIKA